MTVKSIDRRHSAAPATDAAAEAERLRRRRDIREQAARRDLELAPAKMAEEDIAASESRCDQLADEHARLCQPWQDELAALEQTAIQRIGARLPADKAADERRAELAKLIADANADLETAVSAERELQGIARQRARRTREGHPPSDVILMALARPPAANPSLLIELHCATQAIRFAEARLQAAQRALKLHEANADGLRRGTITGDLAAELHHAAKWQGEVAAAGEAKAEAMAESKNIHQRIIDE